MKLPNQQLREFVNMSCLLTSHQFTLDVITTDEMTVNVLILAGHELEILIQPNGQFYYNKTISDDNTGKLELKNYVLRHREHMNEIHKLCEVIS